MFFEQLRLALQANMRNRLRSLLTVLGIVIGVGAVIAMVTIGNGTTARVTADLVGGQGRPRRVGRVVHDFLRSDDGSGRSVRVVRATSFRASRAPVAASAA